ILHNERGETLLHSRRAYVKPDSEIHAALLTLSLLLGADRSLAVARIDLSRSLDSLSCSYSAQIALLRLLVMDSSLAVTRRRSFSRSRSDRSPAVTSLSYNYSAQIALLRLLVTDCSLADLQSLLNRMDSWCLCLVSPTENRASESIARSVTRDNRSQSYVAQNSPLWLTTILQADAMCTL
ncbi:hypothetical protein HID58_052845, partial [Brassica napus]